MVKFRLNKHVFITSILGILAGLLSSIIFLPLTTNPNTKILYFIILGLIGALVGFALAEVTRWQL